MRRLIGLALCFWLSNAHAAVEVSLCFNYGCLNEARVSFADELLERIAERIALAGDGAEERTRVAAAIGELYREAGRQSPIGADRAGDYLDEGVDGKMDCIDHATSTDRLLTLLEARGMLRFHRVAPVGRRTRLIIFQHFSAVLEERALTGDETRDEPARRFAIDSWFVEHGEAAVVLPLEAWLAGEGPNVQ